MPYDWDPAKAASNLAKHGVAFEAVDHLDWETALVRATFHHGTGEPRMTAVGAIGDRLHVVVFSIESPCVRIISLRKANNREIRTYGQN